MFIHQIYWEDPHTMPPTFATFIKSWQEKNPEYDHVLWGKDEITNLIIEDYPNFASFFRDCTLDEKKRIAKYFILHHYGGVYAHINSICTHSITPLITQRTGFSSESGETEFVDCAILSEHQSYNLHTYRIVSDHFIYAPPNHHFINWILRHLHRAYIGIPICGMYRRYLGNYFLSQCVKRYTRKYKNDYQIITGLKILRVDLVNPFNRNKQRYSITTHTRAIYFGDISNML